MPRLAPVMRQRFIVRQVSNLPSNQIASWKLAPLCSPQRKPIVHGLPQTQPHQSLAHAVVDLGPESAHDVFAGRGSVAKIFRLQIKVSILPRLKRVLERVLQGNEIVNSPA